MPKDADEWAAVVSFIASVGPRIRALIDHKLVGLACIDFAVLVRKDTFTHSFTVSAIAAEKAGLHSIDVEMSVYLANEED